MPSTNAVVWPRHRIFAALYDRMMASNAALLNPLRESAAGGASGRVLEIGAGTGQNLAFYDWSRVTSLELTEPDPYMLRRAQARVTELDTTSRAKVATHDSLAEILPFEDARFDTVVATLVLCTVTDPERAVAEIRRVLRPGGQLRLVEHMQGRGLTSTVQRTIQPLYGRMSGGCQLSRRTEDLIHNAGFRLEQIHHTTLGVPIFPTFVAVATKPDMGE